MKTMLKYLNNFLNTNPEKFNKEFIMSRSDNDVLEHVKDIFKSLEIINEFEVLDVKLTTDESQLGPIRNNRQFYKSILPSRLNKITYRVKITPSNDTTADSPIMLEDIEKENNPDYVAPSFKPSEESFIVEKDIFINKLIDKTFYINEGARYFLTYQIVDNATYGNTDSVSLKSLAMPINVSRKEKINIESYFDSTKIYENYDSFEVLLFSKRVSPLLYVLAKYAYNSLVMQPIDDEKLLFDQRNELRDTNMLKKFNQFWGTNIKISDDELSFEDGWVVIKHKNRFGVGTFIGVEEDMLLNHEPTKLIIGSLLNMKIDKKSIIYFTEDDFNKPMFWIDKLASIFTKNADPFKKYAKIKNMLISFDRLIDDPTRKTLKIGKEHSKDTLSILKYIIMNFEKLSTEDNFDLDKKRIRMYEYQLYPLRILFASHIFRILNSPSRTKAVLERVFSSLSPMHVVKQTVSNELLRYYNATNEMNLFTSLLRYSIRGPQSLSRTVSMEQRDIHPSHVGRLSLIAASPGDPGLTGTLSPFVEIFDGYFKEQEDDDIETDETTG